MRYARPFDVAEKTDVAHAALLNVEIDCPHGAIVCVAIVSAKNRACKIMCAILPDRHKLDCRTSPQICRNHKIAIFVGLVCCNDLLCSNPVTSDNAVESVSAVDDSRQVFQMRFIAYDVWICHTSPFSGAALNLTKVALDNFKRQRNSTSCFSVF